MARDPDFSISLGGPVYQLYLRTGLARPPLMLLWRRIGLSILIAWVPVFFLSLISGAAIGGGAVPFLYDLDTNIRLLVTIPLLLLAESTVHARIVPVIKELTNAGVVSGEETTRFKDILSSVTRLRDSKTIEILILILALLSPALLPPIAAPSGLSGWENRGPDELSAAGYWYLLVSIPILRFLAFRWYFRILVWYLFLWKLSRLKLVLNPLHPDLAGGLRFLSLAAPGFIPFLLAHTFLVAGFVGNHIWHGGGSSFDYKFEILGIIAGLLVIVFLPFAFFLPRLAEARRIGLLDFGAFGGRYVSLFAKQWIMSPSEKGKPLLGTSDIQSLTDLASSFDIIRRMKFFPFEQRMAIGILMVSLLPLLPLFALEYKLLEILKKALTILL